MSLTCRIVLLLSLWVLVFSGCEDAEVYDRKTYSVNAAYFSIRSYPEWIELTTKELPWGQAFENMDPQRQGMIASFFRDTIGLSMRSAHVRMEYFSRKLPNCSNNDSVSMYIEKIMKQKYGGLQTMRDTLAFETADGRPVAWVDAVSSLNGIWFSWAYIPFGDYYVALNLSTFSENEYRLMKEKFRNLAQSFQEEESVGPDELE